MSMNLNKVKEVTNNPQNIFLLVTMLVGGGSLWAPVRNLIQGITDRQDVTSVILCTDSMGEFDEECLDNAWGHVIKRKMLENAKHGNHH